MMIGARTGAWAKSGYTAKDYVQDGLLYMYDGIENYGYGIHNPDALWMTDLVSGTKQYFLANDRQIVRDNCVELLAVNTVAYLRNDSSVMAIEIVCSELSSPKHYAPLLYASSGRNRVISVANNNKIGFCGHIDRCVQVSGTSSVSANYTTASGSDGSFVAKINNAEVASYLTGTATTWQANSSNIFGGVGGFYSAGKIYCIRAYNHNLTDAEIAANYAIDKARFNLP